MCDERDQLIGYLYNEDDAAERRRVEAHLETCDTCRDEIRGLRRTREDLLAWDVPERPSVWTPFAPARVAPSWRDVPRWALAAAAGAIFFIGAAGGFLTRMLVPVPAEAAAAQSVPAASSDLAAIQSQLRDLVRSEMSQQATPVSMSAAAPSAGPAVSTDELLRQVRQLIAQSEQRQGQQVESRVQSVRETSLGAILHDFTGLDYRTKKAIQQLTDRVSRQDEAIKQLTLASQPGR